MSRAARKSLVARTEYAKQAKREATLEPGVDTRCKTCRHPERASVDAALVDGVPERRIAGRFRLSPASVHRHREHVGQLLGTIVDPGPRVALADRLHRLTAGLEALAEDAWMQGDAGVYILAARELRSCYELLGRATGELTR